MYRASTPIFDVPEFPPLRRVKPLPKRRRTSDPPLRHGAGGPLPPTAIPGPNATADELIAHADNLSAQMALQSYYMPILGGVHDLFKHELDSGTSSPFDLSGMDFGFGDLRGEHEENRGDGDYIDHLQQPGNTKKRKVPANMSGAAHGHDSTSGNSGGEDEPTDRAIPTGHTDREYDSVNAQSTASPLGTGGQRKGKLSRATLAGLRHKELLRSRKRQLAAVLGALSHSDTLALDQALSANYPFANNYLGFDRQKTDTVKIRLSRRRIPRLSRAFKAFYSSLPPSGGDAVGTAFPKLDFSFVCPSATSERLTVTKEEVAALHAQFETELARQAAKAAEVAKQAAAALSSANAKRSDRSKQGRSGSGRVPDQKGAALDQSLLGISARGAKKKKRSALANASNPHHLRNYVPSRLPHSGQANAAQALLNAQNLLNPLPLQFLAANVPPRRRAKSGGTGTPISTLSNPADEWICPFCEYDLFYGDESNFQRAVRSRKKILKRRRRARERAAAAASGAAPATAKDMPAGEDAQAEFEAPYDGDVATAAGKQTEAKLERDRGGPDIPAALG